MSTIDTSTWNPDPALNESIGDILLNESASIKQTWQAIQMLMAAGGLHGLQLVPFTGATASADGKQGLVPAPEAGDQDKVLKGDGTWGTAATATAFSSSKSVTLTGAVTGTASSTGGWTVPTLWRSCLLGRSNSGTSKPWYKVASRTLASENSSYSIAFFIENCNTANKFSGILHTSLSTRSDKTIISANTSFRWLANNGFALEDFILVCPNIAAPTVEIWAKFSVEYLRRRFVVISEGTNTDTSIGWILYSGTSAGQEASIPTAGTQVVSSASLLEQRVKALEDAAR